MIVRLPRASTELVVLIVAETRRHPGCANFDAALTVEPVVEPDDFSYRTWDIGLVTLAEPCLTPFREAVDRVRHRFELWPWPEPAAPAHGTAEMR